MARVVVHATIQATAEDVRLIVSVSGADDGLPRSGLAGRTSTWCRSRAARTALPGSSSLSGWWKDRRGSTNSCWKVMVDHHRWCRGRSYSLLRSAETRRVAGRTIVDRRSRSAAPRSPRRHQPVPWHCEVMCVPTVTQRGSRGENPRRRSAEQEPARRVGHANGMPPAT